MRLTREERAARKASFQNLSPADKASYIFSYYKLPVAVGLVLLYLLGSAAYRQLTKKEVLVYPAFINISVGDGLESELTEGFLAASGANPRKAEVYLYSGLYLTNDPSPENHQYAYASSLKIMAAMESKELDVVLMNREAYDIFSQQGYLLDFRSLSDSNDSLYRLLEPHLTTNSVILEDNAIEYTLNQADQYQAVTEEAVNGLDVSGFPMFQEAGFADPVYLGVDVLRLHVLLDQEHGEFHGHGGGAVRAGIHVPPDDLSQVGAGAVHLPPAPGVDYLLARQGHAGLGGLLHSCAYGGHHPGCGSADVCRELRGFSQGDGPVRECGELMRCFMFERMLDKQAAPTVEEMTEFCGENAERFSSLNEWLTSAFGTETKIVFPYGNHYGCGIAHRKKKNLICNVLPKIMRSSL